MAALFSAAHLSRISSVLTLFFHRLCYNIFYGVGYYTHSTMAGFIRLEPRDLDEDPTNLTVTLSMPKQYVEKDSIRIPPFSTNSTITEYTIGSVEENGENYTISIYFTVYDRTQTLMLPFTLSFLDDVVPDNYRLPVTASVSGGNTAAPNIYRPLYKDWEIQKFVNSNRLDAFGKDGAEVVVTPQEEGGNPYLDDLTYVDFAFIVNKYTNDQCGLADLRNARSVTLTDTLPTYTDRNGVGRIAVFDADQNPGWTLMAEPSNSVALTAIPSGEAPGETHPEADDPLRFRLTTDPTTQGKFTKGAEKGDIYDVEVYKTNPYPWSLALSNGKSQPLRHIVIQDRTIVEDGEVVLAGLDEALRFVRLESVTTGASLPEGKTYADLVDHITAYYTDGTIQPISALQADAHGNITVTFDEEKVCDGYDIVFAEDYEMQAGGQVRFRAYTVYRDPEHTHVPDGQTKVTYTNAARSINSYPLDGETDDKIAYAFSDATIIAAQSMYAEKFIAPAGSDSWSKQGLLVKAGSDFDYLLEIVNETAAVHTGLTVYDTLPRIGDPNPFGASGRGSEFPVRLRSAITPPEGYTVYYTTSPEVYTHSMEEMVSADIWAATVSDYASVTAFKLVAGEGTVLAGNSRFQVRIPVCAPKTFDEDSMALLRAKIDQDQASGTVSWLQAVNAFGFRTVQTPTVEESNTVWARVCFAGFCVKKVNGATQAALPGAEFTLTDAAGTVVGTAVSDADGRLQFRELTEGAYVLPKTGGRGTAAFYIPGAFLLLSAAALPDLRKCRSRKR